MSHSLFTICIYCAHFHFPLQLPIVASSMASLYFLELTDVLQPAQAGFHCHDRTLSMPYMEGSEELLPLLLLLSLAFAGPAASVRSPPRPYLMPQVSRDTPCLIPQACRETPCLIPQACRDTPCTILQASRNTLPNTPGLQGDTLPNGSGQQEHPA